MSINLHNETQLNYYFFFFSLVCADKFCWLVRPKLCCLRGSSPMVRFWQSIWRYVCVCVSVCLPWRSAIRLIAYCVRLCLCVYSQVLTIQAISACISRPTRNTNEANEREKHRQNERWERERDTHTHRKREGNIERLAAHTARASQ